MNEDLAALEHFVVDNDDLLELESLIGRFNLFDALDLAREEIRHSNCLAFLLDPAEAHGQGPLFAKAFLMDLLRRAPPALRPLSPIQIDGTDLAGLEVRREWQHVDLLLSCEVPPFVVAIENKVDSSEHSSQLSRYTDALISHFPNRPWLGVLLTVGGNVPSHTSWVPYSYADLHRVFKRVRAAHHDSIGGDVLVFVDHYLNLIGSQFMNDPKIDELCQRIYRNHRRALRLIYDHAGAPAAGVLGDVEDLVHTDLRWHVFGASQGYVDFVPREWLEWLPGWGLDFRGDPRSWFVVRLELLEGRLSLIVEVRKMQDVGLRRRIVQTLLTEGPKVGFRRKVAKETGDSYTRISGREEILSWPEEEAPDSGKLASAVRSRLDEIYPKVDKLKLALQKAIGSAS